MVGTEEEERWESEGGCLLEESDGPEENKDGSEELILRNHPSEPGFLPWRKLTD